MSKYLETKDVNEDNVLELIDYMNNEENSYFYFELLCKRHISSKMFPKIDNKLTRFDLIDLMTKTKRRYNEENKTELELNEIDIEYFVSEIWKDINEHSKNMLRNCVYKILGYGVSVPE